MFDIQGCVSNVASDASTSPMRNFFLSIVLLAPIMLLDVSIDHGKASES